MIFHYELHPTLAELERLCCSVDRLQDDLQCTDRQLFEIKLILEELCTNIIHHGAGNTQECFWVELRKDGPDLHIEIRDTGPPFDPTKQAPKVDREAPLAERKPGGLGLHLIRHFSDGICYKRDKSINSVTVWKRLSQPVATT